MKSIIDYFSRTAIYVTQSLLSITIQFLAIGSLLILVIGTPLVARFLIPQVIDILQDWLEEPGLVGGATFLAIVGALGVVPYLFFKATESIPASLRAIWDEIRNICRDRWVPRTGMEADSSHVLAIAKRRVTGIRNTILATISIVISLMVIASAVAWAISSAQNGAQAVIRINGDVIADTSTEGIEIDIRCESNNGTTISENVVERDPMNNSHSVYIICQHTGGGGPVFPSPPAIENFLRELQNFLSEIDEHLDRHLNLIDARINQLDEDWQELIEESSP